MPLQHTKVRIVGGVSQKTLQPIVTVTFDDTLVPFALPIKDALSMANGIRIAAEGAQVEAYLARYVADKVVPPEASQKERDTAIATILEDFAEWRASLDSVVD